MDFGKSTSVERLKKVLSNPPLMTQPKEGEQLLIYLVGLEVAVSAFLIREEEGT